MSQYVHRCDWAVFNPSYRSNTPCARWISFEVAVYLHLPTSWSGFCYKKVNRYVSGQTLRGQGGTYDADLGLADAQASVLLAVRAWSKLRMRYHQSTLYNKV